MTDKNEISVEEKIDFIYDRLKKQQKVETLGNILKWATRLFVVISLLYFFFVKLPVLKDEIIESITPEIPSFDVDSISNSEVLDGLKEKFGSFGMDDLMGEIEEKTQNNSDF